MSLTSEALERLRVRRNEAYYSPWKPGKQLTDDELLYAYIKKLEDNLSLTKDELFLHTYRDDMGR